LSIPSLDELFHKSSALRSPSPGEILIRDLERIRAGNRLLHIDNVFNILSVSKAFLDVIILSIIERGELALTKRVGDIIPELNAGAKETVTIFNLLTHTAGSPQVLFPVEAELMGNLDAVIKAICPMELIQRVPSGLAQGLVKARG
jgi:CubicO group peptidase (beta-lactamase class C family)